ncbi:MazG family protein [Nakamurella sp. YIM 132084]|uniref:MazG family protein n=2 Tax=Nakamurella leprariae TaxID=2803911 RepID=A0A938YEY8_9ACTN|nr:MazG family protein [Nakamurella leprariae]
MNRLRSPGGCPWDAEQTHVSLLRYLVEECYELVDAVERGDRAAVREELGDVLLQVLFHARIAEEDPDDPFDINDVAGDLVGKLVRRHPHVFGVGDESAPADDAGSAQPVLSASDQQVRWDQLKAGERGRGRVLSGVALGQPAAALAGKLGARAAKFDVEVPLPEDPGVGGELFRIAYAAGARGEDPETALRAVARAHAAALQAADPAGHPGSDAAPEADAEATTG